MLVDMVQSVAHLLIRRGRDDSTLHASGLWRTHESHMDKRASRADSHKQEERLFE